MQCRAAFDKDPRFGRQMPEDEIELKPPMGVLLAADDFDALRGKLVAALDFRREDNHRDLASGADELRTRRKAQARIQHSAQWRTVLKTWKPTGQQRIVGKRGADANHDDFVLGAKQMPMAASLYRRDPFAVATGIRDKAVGAFRDLECYQRPALELRIEEARVQRARLGFANA